MDSVLEDAGGIAPSEGVIPEAEGGRVKATDAHAFDVAETAARALLNVVLEMRRTFGDDPAYDLAELRAFRILNIAKVAIGVLPTSQEHGKVIGTIGGGDATGPEAA